MSLDLLDLRAKISLDSSDYDRGLGDAERKASSFGGAIKSGLGTVAKVGAAAIATATTAAVGFATASVNAGKSFDSSMSQVAATMGLTMGEMENVVGETDTSFGHFSGTLREFAQYMGSNTAFSASEAADALNYMALAGYDAQQSMDMLPNVLNLAAAGNMDLASASDMVTDAQTALGLSFEQTNQMVDMMAKTSSTTNTSVSQLGEAILTVGGTAKNLAYGTEELNGVLGVMADNGIKGAEAGTHLRNILLAMNPTTDAAAAAWERLGVDAYTAEGELRGLDVIFGELSEAMEDMTDQEKTNLLSDMFNKTDLTTVNALLSTTKDRWGEVYEAIENSQGAAQAMAETQLDNLEGDITKFKSALEGAQITLSDVLTPSLREFVQFGTDGISRITEAFQSGGLEGAMDAVGQVISEALTMITDQLPKFVEAGMSLLSSLAEGIIQNLPQITDAAIQIITMLAEYFIQSLPEIVNAATEIIIALANGLADALPELVPATVDAILTIVEGLVDNLDKLIDAAVKIVVALAEGIMKSLPKLLDKAPEIIAKFVQAVIRNTPKLLEAATEIIANLVTYIVKNFPKIVGVAAEVITEFIGGMSKLYQQINQAGIDIITKVWDGIKTLNPFQWGADLIANFISGITSGVRNIAGAVSGVGRTIKSYIGFSEPEKGPLSDFHTYAPDMVDLFVKGLKDGEGRLQKQLADTFSFSAPTIEGNPYGNTYNGGSVTVNVYGAEGQDVKKLADAVIDRINFEFNRQRRAIGWT